MENCIKSIIDSLLKVHIPEEFRYIKDNKSYTFTDWQYVWTYYQAYKSVIDGYDMPSFIETIYKMASGNDIDKMCTGQFRINSDGQMITQSFVFQYETDTKYFNDFLDEFHKRLNTADCKFTSLSINYQDTQKLLGHHNMLLIYRDIEYKKNYMFLYEPHGSFKSSLKMYDDINKFISFLEHKYNEKYGEFPLYFTSLEEISEDISQRSGIQGIIEEYRFGIGYCVMYSYFWLYLILSCYNKTKEDPLMLIIYIEKTLLKNYTGNQLKKIIVSFAIKLVNFYLQNTNQQYILDDLNKEVDERFNEFILRYKTSKSEQTRKRKKERGDIGDVCMDNSECISNYCNLETKGCSYNR